MRKKICKIFLLAPCFLPFSSLNSEGYFSASQKIKCEEVINVLKTELEVVTVGTPDITALSDDERRVFFETIMARVLELAKERNWSTPSLTKNLCSSFSPDTFSKSLSFNKSFNDFAVS